MVLQGTPGTKGRQGEALTQVTGAWKRGERVITVRGAGQGKGAHVQRAAPRAVAALLAPSCGQR